MYLEMSGNGQRIILTDLENSEIISCITIFRRRVSMEGIT